MRELYKSYYVAQLGACRGLVDTLMASDNEKASCIRQLETVLRLKEIELAEAQNQIAHLQKRLQLPLNPVGYLRE